MSDIPLENTGAVPEQEKEIDLRDEVASVLKEATATPPEGETADQRADRLRDASGKFVKEGKQETGAKERKTLTLPAASHPGGAPVPAEQGQTQPTGTPAAVKAPEGWTAAAKAKFATLDPDVQAEIARRETDMHKQFTRQDDERNFGREVMKITTPYLATINAEGGTPLQAYQLYLNTAHIMRTGSPEAKKMALLSVAQQFNVDLGVPVQQAQVHPVIESLTQRLGRMEQERQQEIQQRQLQEQHQLTSEIDTFRQSAGHEHFDQVKSLMGALLENGQAKDLQEAYDQATWANPEIRSTLAAAQTVAANEKRLTEAKAQADAARRASGSLSGGPGGAKPNGLHVERSLEDEVRANLRAATGRV